MRDGWQATLKEGKGETGPRCHGNQDGLDIGQTDRTAPNWHHVPRTATHKGTTAIPAKCSPVLGGLGCNPPHKRPDPLSLPLILLPTNPCLWMGGELKPPWPWGQMNPPTNSSSSAPHNTHPRGS